MAEIDSQLLEQGRFALVPLGAKCRQPAGPQSTLLPHAPAHSAMPKRGRSASADDPESGGAAGRVRRGRAGAGVGGVAVAVLGLRGRRVPRHGLLGRVGGGVELQVLRVVRRLGLGVELGHGCCGLWGGEETVRAEIEVCVWLVSFFPPILDGRGVIEREELG